MVRGKTGVPSESRADAAENEIPGKKSESFDVEQPWSLIGIVPQGGPDRAIESNRETTDLDSQSA